jgi:hypothetical protein
MPPDKSGDYFIAKPWRKMQRTGDVERPPSGSFDEGG